MYAALQVTRERAEALFQGHRSAPFFEAEVRHLCSGPCVALVLARNGAVQAWREAIGPSDLLEARKTSPNR